MNWLTPHPQSTSNPYAGTASPLHSTEQQDDPESGHGPERFLSHLPDAVNYIDGSRPPEVASVLNESGQ